MAAAAPPVRDDACFYHMLVSWDPSEQFGSILKRYKNTNVTKKKIKTHID